MKSCARGCDHTPPRLSASPIRRSLSLLWRHVLSIVRCGVDTLGVSNVSSRRSHSSYTLNSPPKCSSSMHSGRIVLTSNSVSVFSSSSARWNPSSKGSSCCESSSSSSVSGLSTDHSQSSMRSFRKLRSETTVGPGMSRPS